METLEIETHPGSGTEEGQGEICIKMDLIGFQPPTTGKMGYIETQIFIEQDKSYDLNVKLQRIEMDFEWTLNRTGPELEKKKLSW